MKSGKKRSAEVEGVRRNAEQGLRRRAPARTPAEPDGDADVRAALGDEHADEGVALVCGYDGVADDDAGSYVLLFVPDGRVEVDEDDGAAFEPHG